MRGGGGGTVTKTKPLPLKTTWLEAESEQGCLQFLVRKVQINKWMQGGEQGRLPGGGGLLAET